MKIKFVNAVIFNPAKDEKIEGCLISDKGIITYIGKDNNDTADKIIDCKGKYLIPGLVDIHVHLREPGQTQKEDIISGCNAAVAGGVTSLIAMPNTNPAVDNADTLDYINRRAKLAKCRVYQACAITKGLQGDENVDFDLMIKHGAIAFSDDGRPVENSRLMLNALKYASENNIPVLSHTEDLYLASGGKINEGIVSKKIGIQGIPSCAEDSGTAREIALCESTGYKVHICHVSTKGGFEMLRDAKARGVKVTLETCPHYFTLTEDCLLAKNADFRMNPPLRTESDRIACIEAIKNGTVDAISTDHAPHTAEEKSDFEKAPNGSIGMETSLSISYTALCKSGEIDFMHLLKLMSTNPAKIANLDAGRLEVGAPADIVVFDKDAEYVIDKNKLHGKSTNCPFDKMKVNGRVLLTVVRGEIVYNFEEE